jgi:transposase-like protein
LFARLKRGEQALLVTLVEMVVQDVSARTVSAVVAELCGT